MCVEEVFREYYPLQIRVPGNGPAIAQYLVYIFLSLSLCLCLCLSFIAPILACAAQSANKCIVCMPIILFKSVLCPRLLILEQGYEMNI
jgi:hypothetical protein